jgi:hypothetical protein
MAIDITLTSVLYNPWSASSGEALTGSNTLEVSYASLGFVASTSDSYKSTAGDIFKVFIDGTRIYRTADSLYAGGKNFLETNDVDNSILNGQTSQTWSGSTSNAVWTIETSTQKIILDKTAIAATSLYGSGGGAAVSFVAGAIIEVRREVQDQSSPAVDFSNASILTEQDLDNSSANVFHMAQQAIETAGNALPYETGTGVYESYQPGTTTRKRITQVADPVNDNDAVTKGFISTNLPNVTTVAGISADVTTVATAPVPANLNTLVNHYDGTTATSGTTKNLALLNTVALRNSEVGLLGTSAMATASTGHLARLGVADVVTDMGLLGATGVIDDMALLGADGVIEDMAQLTATGVVADMALLAGNSASGNTVIEDMNTLATSDIVADLNLLATTDIVADLAAVTATGVIADIETVADNVAGVTSFASRYRVAATDPSTSLDEGDLYYNTGTNLVKYYNGSAWTSFGLTQAQTQTEANNAAVAMSIALG